MKIYIYIYEPLKSQGQQIKVKLNRRSKCDMNMQKELYNKIQIGKEKERKNME